MDTSPVALSEEVLLAELGWVRGLALSLVEDAATADDLAQEACLLALERPPRSARSGPGLRAWLARVTRSLARGRARSEARRARREALAARPERDDVDLIEAVSLRRDVVGAVLALDEPFRTTLLRFHFEGRSSAEIARLSRVSEDAVRQRLVRGRAALRARLAETYGGERGWQRALLPLLFEGSRRRTVSRLVPLAALVAAAGLLLVFSLADGEEAQPEAPADESPPDRYATLPEDPSFFPDARAARERGGLAGLLLAPPAPADTSVPMPARAPERAAAFAFGGHTPAEALAAELSAQVSISLAGVTRVPTGSVERAAALSGHPAGLVARAERFDASLAGSEEPIECELVRVPLDAALPGARLVVLFAGGEVLRVSALGTSALEEDRDGRWSAFLAQLPRQQNGALEPGSTRELLRELAEREDDDARLSRLLVTQRLTMAANSLVFVAGRELERRGAKPPADWYPPLARDMRSLAESSLELAPVLGESRVEAYASLARASADALDAYAEALRDGPSERIAAGEARLRASCNACHGTDGEYGESFFEACEPFVEGLGLSRGALLVGYDLAPAPGDDGELSRCIAAAFRASLVLVAGER